MGLPSRQQPGGLVRTALVSVRFVCDMGLRRQDIVESAERSRSFEGCAAAFAACVVAAADFVAVVRCIVGSQRFEVHAGSHREWLVRYRYRQGRALARCVVAEIGFAVALARRELEEEGEQVVVAQSVDVFACKELLKVHRRA